MSKIRSRDAKKLQKSLKAHRVVGELAHQAWELLKAEGIDAALAFVAEATTPQPLGDPVPFEVWGEDQIDSNSIDQMRQAARLPVAVQGALMPDAHLGYGLPIGGVLATRGVVIPYAVGVDIACRMRLTVYALDEKGLKRHKNLLHDALTKQTRFGAGAKFERHERRDHPVLVDPNWNMNDILRGLKDKAAEQLGTSGGGNHFVEWGLFTLDQPDAALGLEEGGTYVALLSHSGSRGAGAKIADYFSRVAMEQHPDLPDEVKRLAWLALDSDAGDAYWRAMQLAGDYAAANHEQIHERITEYTGLTALASVENHHNFAWEEQYGDETLIVHRKGATPAGAGVYGVIPGSMGDAGYVVRGKGVLASLNSASHGAGRKMSRRAAKKAITRGEMKSYLIPRKVELIGGGLDESPHAYKSIERVMAAQTDLVDIVGKFQPRIVRMADD